MRRDQVLPGEIPVEHDVREQEQGQEEGAEVQGNIQFGGKKQRENVQTGRRLPGVSFVFICLKINCRMFIF